MVPGTFKEKKKIKIPSARHNLISYDIRNDLCKIVIFIHHSRISSFPFTIPLLTFLLYPLYPHSQATTILHSVTPNESFVLIGSFSVYPWIILRYVHFVVCINSSVLVTPCEYNKNGCSANLWGSCPF